MSSRRFLILLALLVNLSLWSAFMFSHAPAADAQRSCPAAHVVRPGEWLALIARQYNTTVDILIQLNPWLGRNPNLIRSGEELCVPPLPEHSNVVIETTYQYRPEQDDKIFQLHTTTWQFGARRVLPLQAIDGVEFVTETDRLPGILYENPTPTLVVWSNEALPDLPRTYSLFEIGDPKKLKILPSLQISTAREITLTPGCLAWPAIDTLEVGKTDAVTTTLWLEDASGMRMPFSVTGFGVVPTETIGCLEDPAKLALFLIPSASDPNTYRLKARLGETGVGPDGSQIRWGLYYNYGGWGYYFLRNYYRWGWRNR